MDRLNLTRAQRAALREGLKRRFPAVGTDAITKKDTHTPDLAANVLYTLLSNPRYKAVDETVRLHRGAPSPKALGVPVTELLG